MLEYEKILEYLTADSADELFALADESRKKNVGDDVYLRGLIEFSNYCRRQCGYCGIRAGNKDVARYRMSKEEILECAREASVRGYGTTVIQGGEDMAATGEWVADVIRSIKKETGLAITLSLGEREPEELKLWRECGADRYLLRFETGNDKLYETIHPSLPGKRSDRFEVLKQLREYGYEVGSGVLIGIPGQTFEDLARDIHRFGEIDLDMIGVGPYIPHPDTPLYDMPTAEVGQVPGTVEMACRVVALARLVCPKSNIPSTTALATLEGVGGRLQGLNCGANILMPNFTPEKYRTLYEIYPSKAVLTEQKTDLGEWLESIGRRRGEGRGDSPNRLERG